MWPACRRTTDVVERGPIRLILKREGSDAMEVSARVMAGQSVMVQETYDPAWQAWHRGRRLPVHQDVMHFLVVAAPPDDPVIALRFVRPLENRIGGVVTLATVVLLLGVSTGANNLGGTPMGSPLGVKLAIASPAPVSAIDGAGNGGVDQLTPSSGQCLEQHAQEFGNWNTRGLWLFQAYFRSTDLHHLNPPAKTLADEPQKGTDRTYRTIIG